MPSSSINQDAHNSLNAHYQTLIKALIRGEVVPFLGAGVNLCGRAGALEWDSGQSNYLPSGAELAKHLAESFAYPATDNYDLVRVSQYVALMNGTGPLYSELHSLFNRDYPPTLLHMFLATLLQKLKEKGYAIKHQLIISTNYDDLMEKAFQTANVPFDVVSYEGKFKSPYSGKFWHWTPSGDVLPINDPSNYSGLSLSDRSVILKLHGAVDRVVRQNREENPESFVITETDYIDYLTRTDISNRIPKALVAKMNTANFLFLGYSLRDWNWRSIFHRIWRDEVLTYQSWAIQLNPDDMEKKFWEKRNVDIYSQELSHYITSLQALIEGLPRK